MWLLLNLFLYLRTCICCCCVGVLCLLWFHSHFFAFWNCHSHQPSDLFPFHSSAELSFQSERLEQSPSKKTEEEAFALLNAVELAYGNINSRSGPWDEEISESLRKSLANHTVRIFGAPRRGRVSSSLCGILDQLFLSFACYSLYRNHSGSFSP